MVSLSGTLGQLRSVRILVIGDLMLDRYTRGSVNRTSPEAPVMILNTTSESAHAGGAGNVALNMCSLGAKVRIVGRIGDDAAGQAIRDELSREGVDVSDLVVEPHYSTPVKNRFIAGGQQVLRVDHEEVKPLAPRQERELIERMADLLDEVDVVAISDYAKGVLTEKVLQQLTACAWSRGVKVIVDPKGKNFQKYSGVTVIKPNLKEARIACGLHENAPLNAVAREILGLTQAEYLLVTLSEGGIAVFDQSLNRGDFPARVREVNDVTGAGDTVLAVITIALANGLPISEAAQLANVAAGIAIERVGCVRVTVPELAHRLLHYDVVHKVFHEGHLFALQQALAGRKFVVLGVDSRDGITADTFACIRKLTQDGKRQVIVYIRDESPSDDFVHLLESIRDVSFIILKDDSLMSFAEKMRPHAVYQYHDGQLHELEHSEALLGAVTSR